MIAFLILLVLITGYMVCAEIVFERDWPRCTIKGFIIALALLFMGFQAFGQTASRYDQVVSTINSSAPAPGGLYPALYIPGSGINVCNAPANAVPCTNYATTFTNSAESAICTAPTQLTRPGLNICAKGADAEGGFGVWMNPGTYQYTITTTYGSFGPYDFTVAASGGGGIPPSPPDLSIQAKGPGLSLTSDSTISINTTTHNLSSPALNSVAYVLPALTRGGADIGDEINKAYASLPSSGGMIYISPNTGGACYNFTTPIVMNVAGKIPNLVGLGTANGGTTLAPQGGLCLNYTPTTGTAMTLDYVGNNAADVLNSSGMSNILLINNSCQTSGGCGSSAVGLDNGNTNAGMSGATLINVAIEGFGTGWRNVSHFVSGESQSVEMVWLNALFLQNTNAVVIHNPTGIVFMKGLFSANGKAIVGDDAGATVEFKFFGTTLVGNTNPPIIDFTMVTPNQGSFYSSNSHFENGANSTEDMNFISGGLNVTLSGDLFENDSSGTNDCTQVIGITNNAHIAASGIFAADGGLNHCPVFVNTSSTHNSGTVTGFMRGFAAVAGGTAAANINYQTFDDGTVTQNPWYINGSLNINKELLLSGQSTAGTTGIQIGNGALGVSASDFIGSSFSSAGPVTAYNALPLASGNWYTNLGSQITSALVIDNLGMRYYSAPAGTCSTDPNTPSTFAGCFGATAQLNCIVTGTCTAASSFAAVGLTATAIVDTSLGTSCGVRTVSNQLQTSICGVATLVSGTATITNGNACTPSASCNYKLQNCGPNASTGIGTLSIGTVTAGTSFVINSLSPANTVLTTDVSSICWRID